jgi:hypothetical protein
MLFVDEAPIASKIQGTSGFAANFSERGPRDSKGRSLRQLDLNTRLLRYPCSYMIYSAQFEQLPAEARDRRLRTPLGDPVWQGQGRPLPAHFRHRSTGNSRDPAGHEAGFTQVFPGLGSPSFVFDERLNTIADSSRISRTLSILLPLGSSSGQSSRFRSGNVGTLIAAPHRHQQLRLLSKFRGQPGGRCATRDRRQLRALP